MLFAPNLAWRNEPLRDYVTEAVGLPVVVENDGNVAAWAEFRYGAARDADDSMVLFTVGTGIGGGIVLGGQLIRGAHGIAAELGPHAGRAGRPAVRLRPARLPGAVRQRQRPGPLRPGRRPAGAATGPRELLELAGGDGRGDHRPMVTRPPRRAATRSPPAAFAQIGRWLGIGLADLVQILDPQVLVVGGGVIDAGDLLLRPDPRASYLDALAQRGRLPVAEVLPAQLGNLAGVVGAADLARADLRRSGPIRACRCGWCRTTCTACATTGRAGRGGPGRAPDVVIVQEAPRRFRWRQKCADLAEPFGLVVGRRRRCPRWATWS